MQPKTWDKSASYFWKNYCFEESFTQYPLRFTRNEFQNSFMWGTDFIKNIVFLGIFTWDKLSQDKVLASTSKHSKPHASLLSSISSNLDAGRRLGLYEKTGQKASATYSLTVGYDKSKVMKYIKFVPSLSAIKIVKERAKKFASKKSKAGIAL